MPMTDLLKELDAVAGLADKATPGEWAIGPYGGIYKTDAIGKLQNALLVGESKSGFYENRSANEAAASNAVNFIRAHHAEIAEAVRAKAVLAWFAGGDTGASSNVIALHMTGVPTEECSEPHDPSDLGRCLRLLQRFPEWKPRIGELAQYSTGWAALVPHWDALTQMMADEVGIDWSKGRSAPITYAAMKKYRYAAIDAQHNSAREVGE